MLLRLQNLDNQENSGEPKTVNSEAALQAIKTNPVSYDWSISGEVSFQCGSSSSQLLKKHSELPAELCLTLQKYCKTLDTPLYY